MFIHHLFCDAQAESDSDIAGCDKWFGGGRGCLRVELFATNGESGATGRIAIAIEREPSSYGDRRLLWVCMKTVEEKLEKCMCQARRVAGDRAFCYRWLLNDLRFFSDQRFCFFKGPVK